MWNFILVLLCCVAAAFSSRTFLQISDIHLDVHYQENGETDWPAMCRETPGTASKFGSYKCDSPKILVESAFQAMKNLTQKPEFILWTGDSSAHDSNLSQSEVMSNLRFVNQKLHQVFPGVPVIPVLGNHDSSPADYFPDSRNKSTPKLAYSDYITDGSFGDLLHSHSQEAEQFKICGFYVLRNVSYDANITQTFIGLNTALYYHNKAIDAKNFPLDPCGQLAWLNKTLTETKEKERVFIVGHVPPGFNEWSPDQALFSNENYTKAFIDIVTMKTHATKIVGHFYGHTHTDSFRIFMDNERHPMGLAFIAPSITPAVRPNGVNPSFREYRYDHVNRTIISYSQFYLPLNKFIEDEDDYNEDEDFFENQDYPSEEEEENQVNDRRLLNSKSLSKRQANETIEEIETTTEIIATTTIVVEKNVLVNGWQFAYNAALDFKIPRMDLKSMYSVYSYMRSDPSGQIFKNFLRHSFVRRNMSLELSCDEKCQSNVICAIGYVTTEDFQDCLTERGILQEPEKLPTPPTPIQMSTTTISTTVFTTTPALKKPKIQKEAEETEGVSNLVRGFIIGLALVALLSMGLGGLFYYRKMQRRRYCSQEFLLDSFRYDGYSQLDQP